jgi:hypothetical protein
MKTASYAENPSNFSKTIVAFYYGFSLASDCLFKRKLNPSNYSSSPRDTG